jgi:hypothetical protein
MATVAAWWRLFYGRIVLEAAQIWRELAPHYFPADCFGGSSDLAGTGSTLFSVRLFRRQLRFGGTGSTFFPDVNAGIFLPGYIPQGVVADGLSTRV